MIKKTYLILIFCLLLGTLFGFSAAAADAATLEDALDSVVEYCYQNKPGLDNWEEVVGLSEAGELDRFDLSGWSIELDESSRPVDYASAILGLLAAGKDPGNYIDQDNTPRDLVRELSEMQQPGEGFSGSVNNTIFSILALDKANASYNVADAVNYLIIQQKSDGGFSLDNSGDSGDPDVTGVALMALAKHTDLGGVNESIDRALDYLRDVQLTSGGFASYGNENAESIAKVIQGLVACGEDVTKWNNGDNNVINALFSFWLSDGSFCHLIGKAGSEMATRQALLAIADLMNCPTIDYSNFVVNGNSSGGNEPDKAQVSIRVEGNNSTLRAGKVSIEGTALDALKELVGENNISYDQWGMVAVILGESGRENVAKDVSTSWKYYVVRNGAIAVDAFSSGPGDYNVQDGDEIVFYIGAYDTVTWSDITCFAEIKLQPAAPVAGETVNITIPTKKYDWSQGLFDFQVDNIRLIINGREQIMASGQSLVQYTPAAGELKIRAEKYGPNYPELVPTEVSCTVKEKGSSGDNGGPVSVRVKVIGKNQNTLYSGTVELDEDKTDIFHALVETGLSYKARYSNTYVYEIDGIAEDLSGTAGWKYKINGDIPGIPAIDYQVQDGDEIIWYWAVSVDDLGNGESLTGADLIIDIPAERQEALQQAREKVKEQLRRLVENWSELAYSNNELYQIVDLLDDPTIVIGAENIMPEQERQQWAKILQNNQVNITWKLKFEEDEEDVSDEAGEVCLTVEKGAWQLNAAIEIEEENDADVQAPINYRFASSVFNFGPEGTSFAKPVVLRIKFTDLSDPENTIVAWYNPQTKCWVPVPSVVDAANGEISGLITHFTKFAVFIREKQIDFFTDIDSDAYGWAQKEIEYLAVKGIVSGDENKFDPDRPVTRAEFVAMLVKALELDDNVDYVMNFSDIEENSWYAGPVKAAVKEGIIKGVSDRAFHPADTVTREQIAAILVRALNLQAAGHEPEFKDQEEISPWAREAVQAAVEKQLVSGYPDGTFRPELSANRAQIAVIIYRLLELR